MEGDLALFEQGIATTRKMARFFLAILLVVIGGFMIEAFLEVRELGRFSNEDQAARTLGFTGLGFLLCLYWLGATYRKHKAIRLLENPSDIKSYKLMILDKNNQISAIWIRNQKGTNYELPLAVGTLEEGERALAALLAHAPHIEAEQHVRLV